MQARLVSSIMSALVALFLLLGLFTHTASAGEIFAREPLTILRKNQPPVTLNVELAVTVPQREQGLMFRRSMGENEGMLFDFVESRQVFMWMKNTVLPLDMLFIDERGRVVHIKQGAVPFSESIIDSVHPVQYVLELLAGSVDRLQLAEGDEIKSKQIGAKP